MFQTLQIVFFSGTGGTARVAARLAEAFTRRGIAVQRCALRAKPCAPFTAEALALLYPVYAANAPQPIGEWIAAAPPGENRPAIVISVSGGGEVSPNTACRVATVRALRAKGYRVVYEAMAVMPANFLVPYSDTLSALLLRKAAPVAERIAAEVLAGVERHPRPLPIDRVVSVACLVEHLGSRLFGRSLHASPDCSGCGLCEANCPRGNIVLQNGRPVFGNRCVFCLRCVYGCPRRGIEPGFARFTILKDGFNLAAVEARTWDQTSFPPVEELTPGKALAGVRAYLLADETTPQA